MQPGDVKNTYADIDESRKELKFFPSTDLKVGLEKFIDPYIPHISYIFSYYVG